MSGKAASVVGWACQALSLPWGGLAALMLVPMRAGFLWQNAVGALAFGAVATVGYWVGERARRTGGRAALAGAFGFVLLNAAAAGGVLLSFQDVGRKSGLAADQGTMAALRSAVAIYYGKNEGTFPTRATLQTLVQGFNGTLQCRGATWGLDTTNGAVTYAPNDATSCR